MFSKLVLLILTVPVAALASGLPPAYRPPPEEGAGYVPHEEKGRRVGEPAPGLHDVRVVFAVGGVAVGDIARATGKLVPVLERRAAGLARRFAVARGPGDGRLTVELKGCADPARALEVLMAPGRLEFQAVAASDAFRARVVTAGWPAAKLGDYEHSNILLLAAADRDDFVKVVGPTLQAGERLLWTRRLEAAGGAETFKCALATGDGMAVTSAIDAAATRDAATGEFVVDFDLGPRDGTIFSGLTGRHVGEGIAVVFDDELFYTARVMEKTFERARITGELDEGRAADIALILSSGSLPATLVPVELYVDGEGRPVPTR